MLVKFKNASDIYRFILNCKYVTLVKHGNKKVYYLNQIGDGVWLRVCDEKTNSSVAFAKINKYEIDKIFDDFEFELQVTMVGVETLESWWL